MNGFDGSLFGGLTADKQFLRFFHGSQTGTWQAINSAMYQIGGIVALPFVGPAIDSWLVSSRGLPDATAADYALQYLGDERLEC